MAVTRGPAFPAAGSRPARSAEWRWTSIERTRASSTPWSKEPVDAASAAAAVVVRRRLPTPRLLVLVEVAAVAAVGEAGAVAAEPRASIGLTTRARPGAA